MIVGWLLLGACEPAGDPTAVDPGCVLGEDVHSIPGALDRLEELPEPTIPCFVQSLPRPLPVVALDSFFSAQPGTWRSPRMLITLPDIVVSVVPDGVGAQLMEFGEWVDDRNTIKGELVFPVTLPLGDEAPYEHLAYGDGSSCGACHPDEREGPYPGSHVSNVLLPLPGDGVPLAYVLEEAAACDPSEEPDRCALMRAVVGAGDVVQGALREP